MKQHPEMGKAHRSGDMVMSPERPQEVLVSMAAEMISRQRSLTLPALVPHRKAGHPVNSALVVVSGNAVHSQASDTAGPWLGKSCKGPTPLVDLKSFLPVVHGRALESMTSWCMGSVLACNQKKKKTDSGLDPTTTSKLVKLGNCSTAG